MDERAGREISQGEFDVYPEELEPQVPRVIYRQIGHTFLQLIVMR